MMTDTIFTLRRMLSRLRRDRRGNVVMIFGVMLLPIMAAVGAAVDYSRANSVRTQLQAAADAASIGSVAKASAAIKAAAKMTNDGTISAGVTDAINIFNAQVTSKSKLYNSLVVSAVVARNNGEVDSTVQFSAQIPTVVLGVFSRGTVPVNGTSKASTAMPNYIDFYLLLDNTPSMGVGATTADIDTLVNNTPDQCAFACHDLSTSPNDYYSKAKSLGVQMRIDVLRLATQRLMDTATATENNTSQFRMAIYTFGSSAKSPGLTTIQSLTSSLSTAKSAASNIDLMTVPYQNYASDTETDFGEILTDINKTIPSPGTGRKASSPQKYLFFVSDGVADRAVGSPACAQPTSNGSDPQTGTTYIRCQEPIDPAFCTAIKNRGIKIAVLYTTYLPLPANGWYTTWVAPFQGAIATNMKNCASPDLYFEVSPSQGISDAMAALFKKAVYEAHLTQ